MNEILAIDVAKYFIEISSHEDEPDLTNLKLQKLLYFAQGKFLAQFGVPLFQEEIEAWDFGPVVKNVYHEFKHCGAFPITVFDTDVSVDMPEKTKAFLDSIWSEYAKYSAGYLVQITHKENSPWQKFFSKGDNNIIPKDELQGFFTRE